MYVSGFVSPVPTANKDIYATYARKAWALFKEHGAVEFMEAWGENVPQGETTDFRRAVKLEEDETVLFSWIIWADKQTAEKCEQSMQTDERWAEIMDMPFDGKRMIYGDFVPLVHEKA